MEVSVAQFLDYKKSEQLSVDFWIGTDRRIKRLGIYQHYKGDYYCVLEIAQHSETEEKMVLYQAMYGDFKLWVRPVAMFFEMVEFNGRQQERFRFIDMLPVK